MCVSTKASTMTMMNVLVRLCIIALLLLKNTGALSTTGGGVNRRDVLITVGSGSLLVGNNHPALAANSNAAPIGVLGASGRTGALCVAACLDRGIPVRALTRSGSWPPENRMLDDVVTDANRKLLTVAACDVKDADAVRAGVEGCRGVIYAASASKLGGSPKEIDNVGVVTAANACLDCKIPQYVVISSTAVTRPNSLGYKFTDITIGGIMGEKRKGEDGVKDAYKNSKAASYVIIRPGGLEEPKKNIVQGPASLELSQGDVLAGIVSRADLAQVAVEAASSTDLKNTAFELYYTDSVQPCEGRFKPFLQDGVARLHGDSYKALFQGIKPDGEYLVPE